MAMLESPAVAGELLITDDVIAELAGYAALECYGVVGMARPSMSDSFTKMLPAHRLRRGVVVHSDSDGVIIDMYVIIEDGVNLAAVSRNLADTVRYVLEYYAQLDVLDVCIHVQDIHLKPRR
ncbi:MAG: Asp23/Gls24 family envelope stress response protein [Actinomycetia bacterium]|nr:Asp23/Gls24 family envelope stress response protein [Actinomycetes bacterium]